MLERDKLFDNAVVCYDRVLIKDDNDRDVLGEARWNEVLFDADGAGRMPAWKWQLWVETRGEARVRTHDGTVEGFIWPKTARR